MILKLLAWYSIIQESITVKDYMRSFIDYYYENLVQEFISTKLPIFVEVISRLLYVLATLDILTAVPTESFIW